MNQRRPQAVAESHYSTIQDVLDDSQGLLRIEHNLGTDGDLNNVEHFIFSPHGKAAIEREEDFPFDPESVPEQFTHLKTLLRSTLGLPIAKLSEYQADGGADEIGRETMAILAKRRQGAVMISPNVIGRGFLDLNRPREMAKGDRLFHTPKLVSKDLERIFDISQEVIFQLFLTLVQKNLKSVIQPHTMASGGQRQGETAKLNALTAQLKQVEEGNDGPLYQNPEALFSLIEYWKEVSTDMNDRRDRPAIDIITAMRVEQDPKLQHLIDGGFAAKFAQELEKLGIPYVFNKPYEYLPGFPGTELAAHAGQFGLKQLTIDVPRHLLQGNPKKLYDVLTFQPDRKRVRKIALAIVDSL